MGPPVGLVGVAATAAVAATAVAGVAVLNRREPGGGAFAVLMAGVALWAGSYAVGLATLDAGLREVVELPIEVGKALIAPAWLLFALDYTGHGDRITPRLLAVVAAVPVATVAVVVATVVDATALLWTDYEIVPYRGAATVLYDPGPWHYVHAAYGVIAIAVGVGLIARTVASLRALYRPQGLALVVGSALPFVAFVKRTFFLGPVPQLEFTPLALAVTGLLFAVALFRFDLLRRVPATGTLGRRAAIDDVGVGVVVVDGDRRVVECNPAAADVLGRPIEAVLGAPLDAFADIDLDEPGRIERRNGARRIYDVTVGTVTGRTGRTIGHTVTFTDVTDRESRQERLSVLNRVLRHNLRNDLTVVGGHAAALRDDLDGERAEQAATIEERARALQRLGEKARSIESLVGSTATAHPTAVHELLADIVERHGEAASNAVDAPPVTVETDPDVLELLVGESVDNAIRHADGEPTVEVRARRVGDGVEITIADDGPGIPEHELAPIRSGSESQLQHGSGIGLWLLRWGARALGGTVAFEDRDSGGTVVRIGVPGPVVDPDD